MSEFWSKQYQTKKGDVELCIYRKRLDAPASGEPNRPVLFLVHGSSLSALAGFDLHVPGRIDYSFMEKFARQGFDVWTMDHESYGRSSRTKSNSDIACGVEDLRVALPVVERETGATTVACYGQSSGALRAAAFAQACPEYVERLVLDAFVWTGEGSPTLAKRRERLAEWRSSHVRRIDRAFIHSIFNRDMPGTSEPEVAEAVADAELALGDTMPTGTYLDMCANLPIVDPACITCPVLIIRGEFDGIATEEDLLGFFVALPNKEKQFVILPGQAHIGPLGSNRARFWHVMQAFLTLPPRQDALAGAQAKPVA